MTLAMTLAQPLLQPKDSDDPFIIVGQLGAPYGVKGWNHLRSFTNPVANILEYRQWFVQQKNEWVVFELVDGRLHGQSIAVHLKGIDDRDKAALLSQCHVALHRSQLPQLGSEQFYWSDLEGMTVKSLEGEELGIVDYLYENAGVDVMVVKKEQQEQHIPFLLNDTVLKVDMDHKILLVDWKFL